jgi:hypothetical protein
MEVLRRRLFEILPQVSGEAQAIASGRFTNAL